ncbi:putative leucine-rich repeat receptor-like protein kinase [Camellia lanceoleosa]|uniref:Leucine-rich repeat receptor-like protein kinase n=1 Tax=Camellia lanceoleosa TaxID=1840588 RepID=A0ACC0J0E0_9ERIC|nr:putative leucine-rich repeat receptor-like protein kinase [Camellia lanceoleosa]
MGVTCNEVGSVTRIDFSSSHSLPGKLENMNWASLPNLEYLNLSNCFSTGSLSIPDEISTLSKLMYLDLSYNYHLQGLLPLTLGNLTQLVHLNISNTEITGTIPSSIGQLTNLIFLCLSSNRLSGTIPPDIGKLSNLVQMYISNNILSGPIPPEIGHLTQLAHLDLSHNFLIGKIPSFIGQLINLNFLDVSANQINDNIPPQLGHFPSKIQYLDLSKNLHSEPIPKELQQLCYLEYLILGSNNLNGTIPVGLAYLPWLKQLDLSHNNLSGKVSYCLCNLIVHDFSYNPLEHQISAPALPKSSSVSPLFSSSMEAKALLDCCCWGNISSRYHCILASLESSLMKSALLDTLPQNTMVATEKCDVYSFGMVALETIMGRHPKELSLLASTSAKNIMSNDVLDPRRLPPVDLLVAGNVVLVAALAFACLHSEPRSRPTMVHVSQKLVPHSNRRPLATLLHSISLCELRNQEMDFIQ